MCWSCDRPGSTRADWLDHMAGLVRQYGWAINWVEPDRGHPPWGYTVGLTFWNLPELVITGLDDRVVGSLLNAEANRAIVEGLPAAGLPFELTTGRVAEMVHVAEPRAHLNTACGLFGDYPFTAVQYVWADADGRWPWEAGFRGLPGGQPVLGPREDGP